MRYDLVIFELEVLTRRHARPFVSETLQELTDLGATLGLLSDLSQAAARALLGSAQQHFDALECGPDLGTAEKVARILRHLEFLPARALVVATGGADTTAIDRLGVSSAIVDPHPVGPAHTPRGASCVVASLSDIVDIVSGRPILRIVR